MSALISHKDDFPFGRTEILSPHDDFGIQFDVYQFQKNEHFETTTTTETAWLLMHGKAVCQVSNKTVNFERGSLFDDAPLCLHLARAETLQIQHETDTQWLVFSVNNSKPFETRIFTSLDTPNEYRGKGQVDDAASRIVRTIFDDTNSDKNCELVLGEVITRPGRWSSYPPHYHPQPEIYHYRFDKPQGYGHGEMGDEVYKIKHHDTLKIAPNHDHAQVAAPGYALYYTWVIRHLPNQRYTIPTFRPEHHWTMQDNSQVWKPKEVV